MLSALLFTLLAQANCVKPVKVEVQVYRFHPNPWVKLEDAKEIKGQKIINISCDLYDKVKVGQIIEPKNKVTSIRLFSGASSVEEEKYLLLEK